MDARNPDEIRCVGCGATWGEYHAPLCPHSNVVTVPPTEDKKAKVVSDGGSSAYYFLPKGATELNDLIEHKEMSFARGNIFKALYRLGEKEGIDHTYDLNKIQLFLDRLRDMNAKGRRL